MCIDQVLVILSKKQLSSLSLKYSCINQVHVLTSNKQMHKCVYIKYSHIRWSKYSQFYPYIKYSNMYRSSIHIFVDEATFICINQVPTYRSSTHVSIKYSCLSIKYSNVYRSSSHIYVDHELTIISTKKFPSVLINYSHHVYLSSTHMGID